MTPCIRIVGILLLMAVIGPGLGAPARAEPASAGSQAQAAQKQHRVVIEVSEADPRIMNLALNNAENLAKFYEKAGQTVQIEIVALGPGLTMVRSDTSPVKDRLATLAAERSQIAISGCNITLAAQSKQENKAISLLPDVRIVPTGIARIVELEEQGWTYIRP